VSARTGSAALALALVLPAGAGPASAAPAPAELRVFAAASLGDVFGDLARAFEHAHPDVRVRLVLAGSPQLVAQLAHGADGDVLATADTHNMDEAARQGLLAGAPEAFARNRLALIVPGTNPARLRTWHDLDRRGLKLVLAADPVPAGHYARELLAQLGAGTGGTWTQRVLANVVSEEDNVKSVLAKVQLGEADAGVVYRTDVTPALARYVHVLEVPDSANVVASYPIAALARARQPDAARAFVALARSDAGRAALARRGFLPPPDAP